MLAEAFEFSLSELAYVLGVSEATLSSEQGSLKQQQTLSTLAKILVTATDLAGSRSQAVQWFKHNPIPGYRYKTPAELFSAGQHDVLSVIIKNVQNGVYA